MSNPQDPPAGVKAPQDVEDEELDLDFEDDCGSDLDVELNLSPGGSCQDGKEGQAPSPRGFAMASRIDKAGPKSSSTGEEFNRRPVSRRPARGTRTTSLIDDLIEQCKAGVPKAPRRAGGKRNRLASPPAKAMRTTPGGPDVSRFVRGLCEDLQESKTALVRRAVDSIGVEAARSLAAEVAAVEAAGGQSVADGSRRRTPGGVFWNLLKGRVAREEWDHIFAEEREAQRERNRRRQARRNQARGKGGAGEGLAVAEEPGMVGGEGAGAGAEEGRVEEPPTPAAAPGAWARSFVKVLVGAGSSC